MINNNLGDGTVKAFIASAMAPALLNAGIVDAAKVDEVFARSQNPGNKIALLNQKDVSNTIKEPTVNRQQEKDLARNDRVHVAQLRVGRNENLLSDLTTAARKVNGSTPVVIPDVFGEWPFVGGVCSENDIQGAIKFDGSSGYGIKARFKKFREDSNNIEIEVQAFQGCDNKGYLKMKLTADETKVKSQNMVAFGVFAAFTKNEIANAFNQGLY